MATNDNESHVKKLQTKAWYVSLQHAIKNGWRTRHLDIDEITTPGAPLEGRRIFSNYQDDGNLYQIDNEGNITELGGITTTAHSAIDHSAASISILDTAGDFTATNVEDALAELQADNEAFEYMIGAWGIDGLIGTGALVGKHHIPVPYATTITRVEGTLDANGAAAWVVTIQDESAIGTVRNAVETNMSLISSGNKYGSVTAGFDDATIPAGDFLRLDMVSAHATASDGIISVYGHRT